MTLLPVLEISGPSGWADLENEQVGWRRGKNRVRVPVDIVVLTGIYMGY